MERFLEVFLAEMTGKFVTMKTLERLGREFLFSMGPVGLLGGIFLGVFATRIIISNDVKKRVAVLAFAEVTALCMLMVPLCLPWKAVRFLYGLWIFVAFLSIHSRILQIIQTSGGQDDGVKAEKGFFTSVLDTFYYNLQTKMTPKSPRWPTAKRCIYYLGLTLLIDGCFFGMYEWIPLNISAKRQEFAIDVVTGVWVLCLMDWNYQNGIIFLDSFTESELPKGLRHRHPLLSTSLAEFWGQRWNPIIMRILQDAFYKPMRKIGSPRFVCVLTCFLGSALLHCIPQFIATDVFDALKMASFFFIHGVLVLMEIGLKEALRGRLVRAISSNGLVSALVSATAPLSESSLLTNRSPRRSSRLKILQKKHLSAAETPQSTASNYQWAVEIGAATLALSFLYFGLEQDAVVGAREALFLIVLAISTVLGVAYVHRAFIFSAAAADVDSADRDYDSKVRTRIAYYSVWTICGWVWQITAVILTLPLFSRPVYNAFSSVYSHSFLVGPIVKSLQSVNR